MQTLIWRIEANLIEQIISCGFKRDAFIGLEVPFKIDHNKSYKS